MVLINSSIEKIDNLQAAISETIQKDPDYEFDERIFSSEDKDLIPVVAEKDRKYGADDFEDYMKTEGAKEPVDGVKTTKPPKR